MPAVSLLADGAEHTVDLDADGRLSAEDFEAATGWHVEDRGLCRGDVCMPARGVELVVDDRIDVAAAAAALARPWVVEHAASAAVLGEASTARADMLASREAPEFALPDIDGRVHRLSDYRGRKVLLAAYASW